VNQYLSQLVNAALTDLSDSACLEIIDRFHVKPTIYGQISAFYYIGYKTVHMMKQHLAGQYKGTIKGLASFDFVQILRIWCEATEYEELPVRHNGKTCHDDNL
jgi:activating signal cointegrator complex subunit 3